MHSQNAQSFSDIQPDIKRHYTYYATGSRDL